MLPNATLVAVRKKSPRLQTSCLAASCEVSPFDDVLLAGVNIGLAQTIADVGKVRIQFLRPQVLRDRLDVLLPVRSARDCPTANAIPRRNWGASANDSSAKTRSAPYPGLRSLRTLVLPQTHRIVIVSLCMLDCRSTNRRNRAVNPPPAQGSCCWPGKKQIAIEIGHLC